MRPYQAACIVVAALLLLAPAGTEAKRRKHKGDDHHDAHKTKSKVKWSSSSDLSAGKSQVSTEEHSYYVKRTYMPLLGVDGKRKSPPYLAIPIAWFGCEPNKAGCQLASNSGAINSAANSLSEGYLCDDDCVDAYEPICGRTASEVAVFYNKCKLNVAKCRTHGLWTDLPYDQCQQMYPKETAYTDKKFRCSPYFRDNSTVAAAAQTETEGSQVSNDSKESKESKESNESGEEKKKNKNKSEKVEPIVLPLQVLVDPVPVPQAAAMPAPKPMEAIAMPPLPVKVVATQAQQAVVKPPVVAPAAVPQAVSSLPAASVAAVEQVKDEVKKTATPAEPIKEQATPKSDKDKLKYVVS